MKKRLYVLIYCLVLLLTGCNTGNTTTEATENPNDVILYYIDDEEMKLKEMSYRCADITDANKTIDELIKQLFTVTERNKKQTLPLPEFMSYKSYELLDRGVLSFHMDITYQDGMKGLETLCKAAIVKSFCQLEYVDVVVFNMNNLAISDETGLIVETYQGDDFVIASASDGYLQKGQIMIYFANEDASALKAYAKSVEITNNVSLEQVVIDALLTGPLREGYMATMPAGTVLNKISVKDGTAYVNFNESFTGSVDNVTSELTIYSVVNSLVELPTISRVQILIGGQKQELYRETVDISTTLERNLDIIEIEE